MVNLGLSKRGYLYIIELFLVIFLLGIILSSTFLGQIERRNQETAIRIRGETFGLLKYLDERGILDKYVENYNFGPLDALIQEHFGKFFSLRVVSMAKVTVKSFANYNNGVNATFFMRFPSGIDQNSTKVLEDLSYFTLQTNADFSVWRVINLTMNISESSYENRIIKIANLKYTEPGAGQAFDRNSIRVFYDGIEIPRNLSANNSATTTMDVTFKLPYLQKNYNRSVFIYYSLNSSFNDTFEPWTSSDVQTTITLPSPLALNVSDNAANAATVVFQLDNISQFDEKTFYVAYSLGTNLTDTYENLTANYTADLDFRIQDIEQIEISAFNRRAAPGTDVVETNYLYLETRRPMVIEVVRWTG